MRHYYSGHCRVLTLKTCFGRANLKLNENTTVSEIEGQCETKGLSVMYNVGKYI